MSEASPPLQPLKLSSDPAVATGHLQTFKLAVLKEWCKEREIVVPKKPVPKKATYIKLLLTNYAEQEGINDEEEDVRHSDNEDSNPPEDTSTIPSEFEETTTATLQEFPDANISHLISIFKESGRSSHDSSNAGKRERNLYHSLLLVDAKEKIQTYRTRRPASSQTILSTLPQTSNKLKVASPIYALYFSPLRPKVYHIMVVAYPSEAL